MDADWHAFCQAIYKEIEGKEWEEPYHHYREMSQAAGAKKPSESQKAKAFAMKAAKEREEEYYDPAEEHLKDPMKALDKALKCLENP